MFVAADSCFSDAAAAYLFRAGRQDGLGVTFMHDNIRAGEWFRYCQNCLVNVRPSTFVVQCM